MKIYRLLSLMLLAVASLLALVGAGESSSQAAPPWSKMVTFTKIEADDTKDYALQESNGPWLIMATTFQGENAAAQAKQLVLDLRRNWKLVAFTHAKKYDFTKPVQGMGMRPDGKPKVMRYSNAAEIEEVAVLVGEFAAYDDPNAQTLLDRIKTIEPESLNKTEGKSSQSLWDFRKLQDKLTVKNGTAKKRGPLGRAFLVTNPRLPPDYFNRKGVDQFVIDMNKNVENCLLDCPAKYTLQVATFTGTVVLDQGKIRQIENGKSVKSKLVDAAEKAHNLTQALRSKGYEAYEFHDRECSIVTVGSFDSVGSPRKDEKIEINPQLHALMKMFAADPNDVVTASFDGAVGTGGLKPKVVAGISLDIQPVPVEVPRRSIAASYSRAQ